MKKDNALITQESTEVVLKKATNIINRTNKILKNSKRELVANPEIVVIDGLMYQNRDFPRINSWNQAKQYANNLRLGGYNDWRLPTIEELYKITNINIPKFGYGENFDEWKKWFEKNQEKRNYSQVGGGSFFMKKEFIQNIYFDIDIVLFDNYNIWSIDKCVRSGYPTRVSLMNFSQGRVSAEFFLHNDAYSNILHPYVICVRGQK